MPTGTAHAGDPCWGDAPRIVAAEGSLSCEGNASTLPACLRVDDDEKGRVDDDEKERVVEQMRSRAPEWYSPRDILSAIPKADAVLSY
jgi:hypothetical protein